MGMDYLNKNVIDESIRIILRTPQIELLGFHAHIGSSIMNEEPYLKLIKRMVAFQNEINNEYHLCLYQLNIGGGFGINYQRSDNALSIEEMMKKITSSLEASISSTNSLINHVMIEPGRSIVGNAGITIYSISQIKPTITDKRYLLVDGGMTDNIRPALYQAIYEVDVVNKMNEKKTINVDVVGKCCESGDFIRKDVMIPDVASSDLLIVYNTGAYNYAMASNYNNQLKPALLRVSEDKVIVASRREELSDLMRLF